MTRSILQTITLYEEDPMLNQFQESLMVTDGASKTGRTLRPAYLQAAIRMVLVIAIYAFGLFTATHAIGQESTVRKAPAATANVLPELVIWPESQEPNLNGVLATGDGGAMIETKETGKQDSSHR
jgi:hypothetical protein